jgi:DNA-binding FadR family transcriptional regulator
MQMEGITQQIAVLSKCDTPVLARARELFGNVVRGEGHVCSTAADLADRIEQHLSSTMTKNDNLTEALIASRYKVGRRVARQVSRVLQHRGIMEPRRGGNGMGGLWAVVPNPDAIVLALHGEIDQSDPKAAAKEAMVWLEPALTVDTDASTDLVKRLLAHMAVTPGDTPVYRPHSTQAQHVASCVVQAAQSNACQDAHIGSLTVIADRYGISLEVAVEAMRILEDHQQVVLKRGRQGGVFLAGPRQSRALHMTNAFLIGNHASPMRCRLLLDAVNYAMIELACQRQDDLGVSRVQHSFKSMEIARNSTELGKAWYSFIRDIADLAGNPILHFTARALAGSILLRRVSSAELPDAAARELFDASRLIMDNIVSHSDSGNKEAHLRCQFALENYW